MKHKQFSLDTREKHLPGEKVRHWERLPREVTQPSSEEVFKIEQ